MSDYEQHNREIVRLRAQLASARKALESALEYIEADVRERFSVSGQNVRDELRAALKDDSK